MCEHLCRCLLGEATPHYLIVNKRNAATGAHDRQNQNSRKIPNLFFKYLKTNSNIQKYCPRGVICMKGFRSQNQKLERHYMSSYKLTVVVRKFK